jgi:hypothetical protein
MTYAAHISSFCWRTGFDASGWFTFFVMFLPRGKWLGLMGFAFMEGDFYVQLLAWGYWLSWLVNVVLQNVFLEPQPNPTCATGLGMPAFESQLATHLIVLLIGHYLLWRLPLGVFTILRAVLLGVAVPFVMVFSGNYTIGQTLAGVGVGAAVGLVQLMQLVFFWVDRIDALCGDGILRTWFGYRESITHLFYLRMMEKEDSYEQQKMRDAKLLFSSRFMGGQFKGDHQMHEKNVTKLLRIRNNRLASWLF